MKIGQLSKENLHINIFCSSYEPKYRTKLIEPRVCCVLTKTLASSKTHLNNRHSTYISINITPKKLCFAENNYLTIDWLDYAQQPIKCDIFEILTMVRHQPLNLIEVKQRRVLTSSKQKPVQSQKNNVRTTFSELCSNVILLTLNRFWPAGRI